MKQLQTLIKRKVTIQEFDGEDGEEYVSIESGCCRANYFKLSAVLASTPKKIDDGFMAFADILSGQKVVAPGLRLFSIDGTQANTTFKTLKKNAKLSFWAITRMNGTRILQILEDNPGESTRVPVEFVLLDVQK